MNTTEAFGIIPLKEGKTLLVKHQKGHWAFPKGHPEAGEKPIETAERELLEETGLEVTELLGRRFEEHYSFDDTEKTVTYFLAHVKGKLKLQDKEIAEARWLTFDEALELATFDECKRLIQSLKG